MRVETSYDAAGLEDNAGRFASIALTSNLAATALHKMVTHPTEPIAGRYRRALRDMAQTINVLSDLRESGHLDALLDRSLGLVDELEPVQLVARLATEPETVRDADNTKVLDSLLQLRDKLNQVLSYPEPNIAAELAPIFKRISRGAMLSAQKAEKSSLVEEGYLRISSVRA